MNGNEVSPLEIREYYKANGEAPFRAWLKGLAAPYMVRVRTRLLRIEQGNLGDYKSLGDGIFELRMDFGPGFRLYFGFAGRGIVLLLCGGDKRAQGRDILRAKNYWRDYLTGDRNG
jgi:putative addiction module killer protein